MRLNSITGYNFKSSFYKTSSKTQTFTQPNFKNKELKLPKYPLNFNYNANISFKGMLDKDEYGNTLVHDYAYSNQFEELDQLAQKNLKDFKTAVRTKNEDGNTPLHEAAQDSAESVEIIAKYAPYEFNVTMLATNENLETPMHIAAQYPNVLEIMAEATFNTEIFQKAVKMLDEGGKTPIHIAASDPESLETIYQHAPLEFKEAVKTQDKYNRTPVHEAVNGGSIASLKIMQQYAPKEFKQALKIADKDGKTPFYLAGKDELKFLKENYPQEFKNTMLDASNFLNNAISITFNSL